jgi:hypothetical protein
VEGYFVGPSGASLLTASDGGEGSPSPPKASGSHVAARPIAVGKYVKCGATTPFRASLWKIAGIYVITVESVG